MNNNNGKVQTPIVWIDCEMTGLDPQVDDLVEIAAIVTDSQLRPLAEGIDLVIKPSEAALEQMSPFVTQMHTDSGLINEFEGGVSVEEAEARVLEYVRGLVPEPGLAPIAGNSIGQDVRFLRKFMPELVDHLHYRVIDVSTLKELAKRWYPRVYVCAPDKNGGHRALGDIQDSIIELQYYRRALLPDELDPTRGAYRELAEEIISAASLDFPGLDRGGPDTEGGYLSA